MVVAHVDILGLYHVHRHQVARARRAGLERRVEEEDARRGHAHDPAVPHGEGREGGELGNDRKIPGGNSRHKS